MRSTIAALCVAFTFGCAGNSHAQSDFYGNTNVTILVGTAVGGSYDVVGRLAARHIGKYLPGKPTMMVQNMPGAGGLIAVNYLYNNAPQDGSVLGIIIPGVLFNQLFSESNVRFDGAKLQWIGNPLESVTVSAVFYTAPAKTWQEAKNVQLLIGATGPTGPDAMIAHLANATLGTKMHVIAGYKGGQDITLAMERGEVHGRGTQTWAGWKATNPEWVAQGKLIPLWQIGPRPDPELANVPLLLDIVEGEENKALVRVYTNINSLGRPLAMGPGVPTDRVEMLRRAFDEMVKDRAFIDDAEKVQIQLGPLSGKELQHMVQDTMSLDKALIAKLEDTIRN